MAKRVLLINGKEVLSIDLEATDVTVACDDQEDFVPIAEYLETTLNSNMMFDAVGYRCSYEWKELKDEFDGE